MRVRRKAIPIAAMAITVIASVGVIAGPAAAAPHEVVVGPGDNVQAAVAAAIPGTTIKLEPGTYHQFVAMPEGVTLEGSGTGTAGGTVLDWPNSGTNPCWNGFNAVVCMASHDRVTGLRVDTTAAAPGGNFGIATAVSSTATTVDDVVAVATPGATAPANDGIFVAGTNATVRGTQTSGFHEGILVTAVGAQVVGNSGVGNCAGIAVFDFGLAGGFFGPLGQASNVIVEGNREQGPGPQACGSGGGIFLLGAQHSTVRDNMISGFNGEAIATDSAYSTIAGNALRDNCLGVEVFNDGIPAPDGPSNHDVVRGNEVAGHPAASLGCYAVAGVTFASGIRLDGATNAMVVGNEVHMSLPAAAGVVDGILVQTAPAFVNPATPAPQNVSVTGNEVHQALNGASGYDIGWDGTGVNVSFMGNECTSSSPGGLCAGN
jgi:hypothetical protein